MRILHTADWHVGKRLGRYDRMDDYRAALAEVAAIADDEDVDLVLVAGDLFDRPTPPIDALRLVLDTLTRRLATPERPVVAIAGNHDSPELFELLAPLLVDYNVHLVGAIKRPKEGGVLELEVASQRALVACFPFLREGRAVDFMKDVDSWYGAYAERVAALCGAYHRGLGELAEGDPRVVKLLMAHFMVSGIHLGGHGLPRGERPLHLGDAYAATEQALPPGPQYVAMGHIHAPQPVPGAPVPAEYAGSLLELDFGEQGEAKRVVIVDVEPGLPASPRSVPLTAGRRLLRASGRWDELLERPELYETYLDLGVETHGPDPGLAERAQREFPHLVKVRAVYERREAPPLLRSDLPWDRLYRDYYLKTHEAEPPKELLAAFREVWNEAQDASS